MTFIPSENPGAFERHLIRRNNNPLFGDRQTEVNSGTLQEMQKIDHEILQQFMMDFRDAMTKSMSFKPNEDSEVILGVKDSLDKLYGVAACIGDDQTRIKESITKLLGIIMQSVRKGAGDDPKALQELDQEDMARDANFSFLESKLVADILDAGSPIEDMDLVPTILSAPKDDLALASQLFDKEQIDFILSEGEKLLTQLESEGVDVKEAAENFVFVEGYREYLEQQN